MKNFFRIILFFLFAAVCLGGCSKKEKSEYITIGALLPLTGESFDEGHRSLNGLQLAMQEINESGGVLGKKLDIVVLDDRGDADYVAQQYNVLKEMGVAAIIGSSYSGVTMVIADLAEKDGIPVISPTASDPYVTKGRRNVFRAIFIDDYQAEAMAKFASNSLNAKTALVLQRRENISYKQATEVFAQTFANYGRKIMEIKLYSSEDEYESILEKYMDNPPDVIYAPDDYLPAANLVNTIFKLGLKNTYALGSDAWDGLLAYVNPAARENAYYTTSFSFDDRDSSAKQFVKNYFTTFSQMPLTGSACAYTCVYILSEAINKTGSINHGDIVVSIKENVLNSVMGRMKFDKDNNPHPNVYIIQIKDGTYSTYEKIADEGL